MTFWFQLDFCSLFQGVIQYIPYIWKNHLKQPEQKVERIQGLERTKCSNFMYGQTTFVVGQEGQWQSVTKCGYSLYSPNLNTTNSRREKNNKNNKLKTSWRAMELFAQKDTVARWKFDLRIPGTQTSGGPKIWAMSWENLSLWLCHQVWLKSACSATEAS